MNKNWYNFQIELIDTETGRISMQRNILIISSLTFSDQSLYRYVSPENEFYTVVIVTKN